MNAAQPATAAPKTAFRRRFDAFPPKPQRQMVGFRYQF
jgi:hypothetical protein